MTDSTPTNKKKEKLVKMANRFTQPSKEAVFFIRMFARAYAVN